MNTRMITGAIVQATSISVLCVVFDGDRVGLLVEAPDDVDEQRQHEQRDDHDHRHQDIVVEPLEIAGEVGDGLLKADLARLRVSKRRLAHAGRERVRRGERRPDRGRIGVTLPPCLMSCLTPLFGDAAGRAPHAPPTKRPRCDAGSRPVRIIPHSDVLQMAKTRRCERAGAYFARALTGRDFW